jgi:hypothetical protein
MVTESKDKKDQEIEEKVEFTPEEAKEFGAFTEDAISEKDAIESSE